jgi:hypothetical protein
MKHSSSEHKLAQSNLMYEADWQPSIRGDEQGIKSCNQWWLHQTQQIAAARNDLEKNESLLSHPISGRRPDIPCSGTPPANSDRASSFELSKVMSSKLTWWISHVTSHFTCSWSNGHPLLFYLSIPWRDSSKFGSIGTAGRAVFLRFPLCKR